jgi:hypothetical protein
MRFVVELKGTEDGGHMEGTTFCGHMSKLCRFAPILQQESATKCKIFSHEELEFSGPGGMARKLGCLSKCYELLKEVLNFGRFTG